MGDEPAKADRAKRAPFWRRLTAPATVLDAADLRQDAQSAETWICAGLQRGQQVVVRGRLRHVVFNPRDAVPTVEAELFDGSGTVTLVWLGRRRIPGIEPGRTVVARGSVGEHDGHRAIYNPRYELVARG